MKRLSVRGQLTLWYGSGLAVILAVFGLAIYLLMADSLQRRIDFEVDEELVELRHAVEFAPTVTAMRAAFERDFAQHHSFEFEISTPGGVSLLRSRRLKDHRLREAVTGSAASDRGHVTAYVPGLGPYRIGHTTTPGPRGPYYIQVAVPWTPYAAELNELLRMLLTIGPLAILGALFGGYLLARKALRPVDRMTGKAEQITAQRLDQRLDVANPDDELGRLAQTLNGMIERLQDAFGEIRRFTADAAHELRTPLTVLRSDAEIALRSDRSPEEYRRTLSSVLEEAVRLSRLTDQLLLLCREDAESPQAVSERVHLERLMGEVVEQLRPLAEDKQVALTLERLDDLPVSGDEWRLRQVVFNLLDNAVKFTPSGGQVFVRGIRTDRQIEIEVRDTGIGIPTEHLPRLFERFYRVDTSRSREQGGAGLGLAISRAIIESHGGDIQVTSCPEKGTSVHVRLPVASMNSH